MKKKLLGTLLCTTIVATLLTGCNSSDDSNKASDNTTSSPTSTISEEIDGSSSEITGTDATSEVVDERENYLVWLKNNYTNFRTDTSVITDSNISVMPNNPTIDTALDMYMSWHIVDSGVDYQQLSESLDTEISSGSSKFYLLRETKELAESFDEGPKSDVFIMLENHSEESITVKQAIEKKWFVIEYSNDKKKYTYGESSMYINLGCSNVAESDLDVMNNYLMKYYGTPNFFGISMNFDYDTIEDFIANEKDRSAYDLGWIGDEYGVFVTIRYDGRSTYDGTETLNIDNIMIVPVEMLEYTQKFSTTPYLPDSTVYNSNLIK